MTEPGSNEAIKEAVLQGVGLAILSAYAVRAIFRRLDEAATAGVREERGLWRSDSSRRGGRGGRRLGPGHSPTLAAGAQHEDQRQQRADDAADSAAAGRVSCPLFGCVCHDPGPPVRQQQAQQRLDNW